jgi:hypothetical protein
MALAALLAFPCCAGAGAGRTKRSIAIYVVYALSFVTMQATVDVYVSGAVNAECAEPGA